MQDGPQETLSQNLTPLWPSILANCVRLVHSSDASIWPECRMLRTRHYVGPPWPPPRRASTTRWDFAEVTSPEAVVTLIGWRRPEELPDCGVRNAGRPNRSTFP